jgi:hypothetical protein
MFDTSENEKQNNLEQIKTVALSSQYISKKNFSSKNVKYIYISGTLEAGAKPGEASRAGPAKYFKFLYF